MKSKLTTKDLIAAGAFAAIYLVLLTVLAVMVLPIVPVLYLATPLIAGIVLGTVYLLYCVKVPKTGAIFILALLVGAITSMASIYPLIAAAVWGVVAEGLRVQSDIHGALFLLAVGKRCFPLHLRDLLWPGVRRYH